MPVNSKHFNSKSELAAAYWELYQQGFSTTDIAKAHGVSRNGVHYLLTAHGYKLREQKELPFVIFNGAKYTLRGGYYKRTDGERSLLHRDMWEHQRGKIPEGYDIHHINGNKQDNRIKNLECISKSDHSKQHGNGKDTQFKLGNPSPNRKSVRRLDNGKVYPSIKSAASDIGVHYGAIVSAIERDGKCKGIKWEYC